MRRIDRWAGSQSDREAAEPAIEAARSAAESVIRELLEAGSVSDDTFAQHRARTLVRAGQSPRSIQARLLAKGVAADVARTASETDPETELAAALVLVRKRRIGAYRADPEAGAAVRMREMALLARAGFSRDITQRALETPREDAESRIFELRR
jgi:regulatory protein